MDFEFPEEYFFTLQWAVPASDLPTKGYASVLRLDERTETFYIESVNCKRFSPNYVYDKLTADIQDDVSAHGFYHNPPTVVYIALSEPLRSHFRQVVDVCRGLPPPGVAASVEAANAAVEDATGVSLLASAVVRDLLVYIAMACNHIASRCTPRMTRNITAIASAGAPSDEHATSMHRNYFIRIESVTAIAEVALFLGGWRDGVSHRSLSAMARWPDQGDAEQNDELAAGARKLLQALIERGQLHASPTDEAMATLLRGIASRGGVVVLKTVVGDGGLIPVESLPADTRTEMLIEAVNTPVSAGLHGREAMLTYLLDDLGFDPNGQAPHWAGSPSATRLIRQAPLHAAMRQGQTNLARLLVERGASMEAKDENGVTPAELRSLYLSKYG